MDGSNINSKLKYLNIARQVEAMERKIAEEDASEEFALLDALAAKNMMAMRVRKSDRSMNAMIASEKREKEEAAAEKQAAAEKAELAKKRRNQGRQERVKNEEKEENNEEERVEEERVEKEGQFLVDKPITFKDHFGFEIEISKDKNTLKGFMSNAFGRFPVSFIHFGFDIDGSLEDLWPLSTSNGYLLSIFACTTHPETERPLLAVEDVSSFYGFCDEIVKSFLEKPDHSKRAWWPFIANIWRTLFRDGVVALTFLYTNMKRGCGSLLNNFYVTKDGRGRILPGRADKAQKEDDIDAFISLMRHLLLCPFIEADSSTLIEDVELNFPAQVLHFFSFAPLHKALPLEYLLNHPSVWSFPELIAYPAKFKSILYKRCRSGFLCGTILNQRLTNLNLFDHWHKKLYGVYVAIWEMGDPGKGKLTNEDRNILDVLGAVKISSYDTTVSIGRYFAAAIGHYNDQPYSSIRSKELTDPEIVEDLLSMFPDFYTVMYGTLGECAVMCSIDTEILAALGTIDEKAKEFPEIGLCCLQPRN